VSYLARVLQRFSEGCRERQVLHIYYDFENNVPYFRHSYAAKRSSRFEDISRRFVFWCDPRPASDHDLRVVEEALARRFGRDTASRLRRVLETGLTMVNPGSDALMDRALEVFVNGLEALAAFYRLDTGLYDALPRRLFTAMLLEEGAVGVVDTDGRVVRESPSGVYAVLDGEKLVGAAARVGERVLIYERWGPEDPSEVVARALDAPRRSWLDVYRENEGYIETLVEKSRRAIEWLEKGLGRRGFLAFSGGKDSMLAALILSEVGSNFVAVYTHIEHGDPPHIIEEVESFLGSLGVETLLIEKRWREVEDLIKRFGPPCRGYRWCTHVLKLRPQLQMAKRLFGRDWVVNYTGSRMFETPRRSLKPPTHVDAESGIVVHSVPYKWPRLLEYLALEYRYRASLPREYLIGFERRSCVACPYKTLYELRLSRELYPQDFDAWMPHLRELCRETCRDVERCLELHLWRFAATPRDLRAVSRALGIEARPALPRPVAAPARDPSRELVCAEAMRIRSWRALEALRGALAYCPGEVCGLCLDTCPTRAITELPPAVDPSRCVSCLRCLQICPPALSTAFHSIAAREGARKAGEWVKKLREQAKKRSLEIAIEMEEKLYQTRKGP